MKCEKCGDEAIAEVTGLDYHVQPEEKGTVCRMKRSDISHPGYKAFIHPPDYDTREK